MAKINQLKGIEHLTKSRLIHIKGGKINQATFYQVLDQHFVADVVHRPFQLAVSLRAKQ